MGIMILMAVGRFSRGLEFQVLLEKEVDADHMSSRGFLEVKNARGIICGCVLRKFTQREFRIRVDWLPAVTTEDEVGELFAKYGHVLKVYKEMAPQVRGHTRYWGHLYNVHCTKIRGGDSCDSGLDVVVRGRRYSMLYVILGLPPRCHRCKMRGHLAYQCVACRYCGSGSHTSEEHSVENARRREFSAVVEGTQGIRDFEMEEGGMEERGQV